MFNFLKEKLKNVLSKFTKKVEEEAPEEKVQVEKPVAVVPPKEIKKEVPKAPEKPRIEKPVEKPKIVEKAPVEKIEKVKPPVVEKPKVEAPKAEKVEVAPKVEKPKVEVEKPVEKEIPKVEIEEKPIEEKGFFARLKEAVIGKPEVEKIEEKVEAPIPVEEKKGFFAKITETITTKKISEEKFEELFWDLELALLENNCAVEVIDKIKQDLKASLVNKPLPRTKVQETIATSLHKSIEDLFTISPIDLVSKVKEKKPFVICFVGVNGSGKTTSIAKVARMMQKAGLSVVMAAADTFRAAAIDQLQKHADNLGIKLVKHDYGSDPAAVAFDAIKHAQATSKDVVLIDTAGRLHSNVNLMDEMRKIVRVAKPDLKIFVGESITGNDCVEQAKQFDAAVGIDGIILAKADVDEKGGAAISVSYVTKKPILYLGVGQEYDDLIAFDKERLLASIGL